MVKNAIENNAFIDQNGDNNQKVVLFLNIRVRVKNMSFVTISLF